MSRVDTQKKSTLKKSITVAEKRDYRVKTVFDAKNITKLWLEQIELGEVVQLGLPEIDDRYHFWRVPLLNGNKELIGETVIDAYSSLIKENKTTKKELLECRLLGREKIKKAKNKRRKDFPRISMLKNTIGLGDSEELLINTPAESVDLIFTSPPYFNARPEYSDYLDYDEYLLKMRKIIHQCNRVLSEGRFFVINISPVLIRRKNRNSSSKRFAVPFDIHQIFINEGFDFIDDIIWVKPEGAGWATGRGRRFAADRNPLQYKPVPVTEYVLVYRKHTDKLIDWHIRNHPQKNIVKESKILGDYEKTNIWNVHPAYSKKHPAIFPEKLTENVIKYYSFKNDVVLDPFAGIGTVGSVASKAERRFVLFEINPVYIEEIQKNIENWLREKTNDVVWINCKPVKAKNGYLFEEDKLK